MVRRLLEPPITPPHRDDGAPIGNHDISAKSIFHPRIRLLTNFPLESVPILSVEEVDGRPLVSQVATVVQYPFHDDGRDGTLLHASLSMPGIIKLNHSPSFVESGCRRIVLWTLHDCFRSESFLKGSSCTSSVNPSAAFFRAGKANTPSVRQADVDAPDEFSTAGVCGSFYSSSLWIMITHSEDYQGHYLQKKTNFPGKSTM